MFQEHYSHAMRVIRIAGVVVLAAFGAWIARLMAHSKVPHPEGRWREIDLDDFDNDA